MTQLTEPAAYIRDRAQRAKDEGLTENECFEQWQQRVMLWTEGRLDSIVAALMDIHRAGLWPWA